MMNPDDETDSTSHSSTESSKNDSKSIHKRIREKRQVSEQEDKTDTASKHDSKPIHERIRERRQISDPGDDGDIIQDDTDTTKTENELELIRSDMSEVNSHVLNAEFHQAKQLSNKVDSRISSVRTKISQEDLNTLETKVQKIEQNHNRQLSRPHVLSEVRAMKPSMFEDLVAKIWQKQGWDTEVTKGSADRGVDIVATKKDAFEKRRHLIQAKRYGENTTVGSEHIQRYAGLYQRDEQVDRVFVVTPSHFTSEAKEVAESRDVGTLNGDELYELLTKT
jgi:restriction endonuclease Mrr